MSLRSARDGTNSNYSVLENSDRRTVIVERLNGSFGFTLQSYGIHYRQEAEVEIVTYVDFVDPTSNAHKAGLRSGDVIVSINGQDVERADHSKLVNVIQSCPDRIRMVVVYENCVRKVELHMKYIRLTQLLESKAREYQEVCAREKSFISQLDKGRLANPTGGHPHYHTLHHPAVPQVILRNKNRSASSSSAAGMTGTGPGCYASKSLPRSKIHPPDGSGGCPSPTPSVTSSIQHCQQGKRRSYLCIGRPSCDCCFRPEAYQSSSGMNQQQTHQRPKSVHLSCYKDPIVDRRTDDDERYLIQPDRKAAAEGFSNCKAYGGYGFGYDYSSANQHGTSVMSRQIDPRHQQQLFYERYLPPAVVTNHNKSMDDLMTSHPLSAQFHNQCRVIANHPHHHQQPAAAAALDSIVFYNRPPQPIQQHPVASASKLNPSLVGHLSGSLHRHQRPSSQRRLPAKQENVSHQDDEGGFNEARRFRTLPASTSVNKTRESK